MEPLRVLFLCVGNMCRSPMAEAIARNLGGGRVEALSAGLMPAGRVSDNALAALQELGHPSEGLLSKSILDVDLHDLDLIVSLIGDQGLAVLPRNLAAERIAWAIHDPLGEDLEAYVATAELLERKIRLLLEEQLGGS
jgi:protein-tyrosine-phosphatase